jgi:two-component system, NarL family, sensor kinase
MSNEIIVILGTLIVMSLGVVLITFILEFNRRQARYYKEKELMNAQFQQALLNSQLEIQEETFKKISEEIHDNIGQVLTLVKLNLNSFDCGEQARLEENVATSSGLLSKAIQDLRDLSKSLNPDTIASLGILDAISQQMELLEKSGAIHAELIVENPVHHINPQVELILFRIVQESLNNIIKHAKATTILVNANCTNDLLTLQIKDDGVGFNTSSKSSGNGLQNMENRCKIIGAKFSMSSALNSGTSIIIELPINAEPGVTV